MFTSVGKHQLRHLRDGTEAYPAMLSAISSATQEIALEMYWFGSDTLGHRFVKLLAERARAGVSVRVIIDALGSSPIDSALFDALHEAGGQTLIFRPLSRIFSQGSRAFRRNHRKLLVCDRKTAFTGGINIGLPWLDRAEGGESFRDDMVELTGPAVQELQGLFDATWWAHRGRKALGAVSEGGKPSVGLASRIPSIKSGLQKLNFAARRAERAAEVKQVPSEVWALTNARRPKHRSIRSTYLSWILGARRHIDITNAYFVPDVFLRRALLRAAARGVRVRILVPEKGDVTFVQWAMEATLERLAKSSIEIYAYRGRVLHSKTAVIDDRVTLGTYNLDATSWRRNLEVNLAVDSPAFAERMRASFEQDLADSALWTRETLIQRGFVRRLLGEFALLFAEFL